MTGNRPIFMCTSEMVRGSFADSTTSRKDCRYVYKISWISIEFVAEHIVKMLLKHCKKCTAAEITQTGETNQTGDRGTGEV